MPRFNLLRAGVSYPAAIVSNGLQAVWDLQISGRTGPQPAPNKVSGVDTLPGTSSISQSALNVPDGSIFDRWLFNMPTYFNGTTGTTISNCKWAAPGAAQMLNIGQSPGNNDVPSTTCAVSVSRCDMDGTGYGTSSADLSNTVHGSFSWDHCYFHNAPRCYVNSNGGTAASFTDCYMRSGGMAPTAGDHMECIRHNTGSLTINRMLIDISDSAAVNTGAVGAAWTAVIFPEASAAGVTMTVNISNTIIVGADALNAAFPSKIITLFQPGAKAAGAIINMTLTNCVFQLPDGTVASLWAPTQINGGVVNVINGGNNRNFNTNAVLVF